MGLLSDIITSFQRSLFVYCSILFSDVRPISLINAATADKIFALPGFEPRSGGILSE